MSYRLIARKPGTDSPAVIVTSTTNITAAAYVQLVASLTETCSAIQFSNGTTSTFQLAVGAAGHEVLLPISVGPGLSTLLPFESQIVGGQRLSVISLDATASSGTLAINFFAG